MDIHDGNLPFYNIPKVLLSSGDCVLSTVNSLSCHLMIEMILALWRCGYKGLVSNNTQVESGI